MRKTNFLSSLGTKLALAAIVLTSSLFTSCEKEDFSATFEPGDAQISLTVNVYDVYDGLVNVEPTVEGLSYTKDGEKFVFTQDTFKGTEVITISATYKEGTGYTEVTLPALKAGGKAEISVSVMISEGRDIKIEQVGEPTIELYKTLFLEEDARHDYNGELWLENASEYILTSEISYPLVSEQTASTTVQGNETVNSFVEALQYNRTTENHGVLTVKASAWSFYRVWVEVYQSITTYKVTRNGEELGTITVNSKFSTSVQYDEIPHPSHAGNYTHGHGHGATSNAGGGIIYGE